MAAVRALPREVKCGNAARLAGQAGKVSLIGADPAPQFDVAEQIPPLVPDEIPPLHPALVVVHHAESTVELTASEFHVLGRPLEFRTRHRCVDDEFQFFRGQPAQIVIKFPRIVALDIKPEAVGERFVHGRHHFRRDLVVRPMRGRTLVVNQRVGQRQRTVFGQLVGMRGVNLLEPRQGHRRKIIGFQLTEKFPQKFRIAHQAGEEILLGPQSHRPVLRRVVVRQQGLQNLGRHPRVGELVRRGRQQTTTRIGRQRHTGRNDQQSVRILRILHHAASEISAQHFRFGRAEQTAPLVDKLPLAVERISRAPGLSEMRRLVSRGQLGLKRIRRRGPSHRADGLHVLHGGHPRNVELRGPE